VNELVIELHGFDRQLRFSRFHLVLLLKIRGDGGPVSP
jgi:hypothetical protein